MALLELQGIAKHFGAIEALKGVDLSVEPGRGPRPDGRQRRRQVDAGARSSPAISADRRRDPDRTARSCIPQAGGGARRRASRSSTRTSRCATI